MLTKNAFFTLIFFFHELSIQLRPLVYIGMYPQIVIFVFTDNYNI